MNGFQEPTLCMPDRLKSCFACCPPIRPAGYEHLPFRRSLRRMLIENTSDFDPARGEVHPIQGFSCWGLGYLDPQWRLIGCLLHPARNNGVDQRFRIDYWDKCRRESCPESKVFLDLPISARRFWLNLAEGLDSFEYSSRKENPLFSLLGWGAPLLCLIAEEVADQTHTRGSFFREFPFFTSTLNPKGNAYFLRKIACPGSIHLLRDEQFKARFERFSNELFVSFARKPETASNGWPSHLLHLDQDFLDFLRIGLKIVRIGPDEALRLKEEVDLRLEEFREQVVMLS